MGRCVLCHQDVMPNSDDGWRKHLIGAQGCAGNVRKTNGIGGPRGTHRFLDRHH